MSGDLDLLPDPDEVATMVERLVGSEWPTSEAQRLSWFYHHELDVQESRRGWGENGSDSFVGKGPERWGGPRFGWHTFEGHFVGVNWFLWHGAPPEAVRSAARQLRDRTCGFAGEPIEEVAPDNDPDKYTAFWEVQGRTIDMYLHAGQLPDGSFLPDSVVQLHVDHTARSHRADEAAVRAQEGAPSQWKAQTLFGSAAPSRRRQSRVSGRQGSELAETVSQRPELVVDDVEN